MPSTKLAVLFVLIGLWVASKVYLRDQEEWTWAFAPVVLALAAIWTLKPQIDYWWQKRYPPDIDPMGKKIIEQYPFYKRLSEEDKLRFRQRVAVFINNKSFLGMGFEDIPDDLKIMIAANAIILTMDQEDYLLEPFDQIVFYRNAFPSPNYPADFHNSELETEDGTLIFSIPVMISAQVEHGDTYNVVLHEWAKALLHKYPDAYVDEGITWTNLEEASGITKLEIEEQIGLPVDDIRPVILHHKVLYPDEMADV